MGRERPTVGEHGRRGIRKPPAAVEPSRWRAGYPHDGGAPVLRPRPGLAGGARVATRGFASQPRRAVGVGAGGGRDRRGIGRLQPAGERVPYVLCGGFRLGVLSLVHNACFEEGWTGVFGHSKAKGIFGENVLGVEYLEDLGHTIIGGVQNRSGNGIDIVTRKGGKLFFWEVKTSGGEIAPGLTQAEKNMESFVMSRLDYAAQNVAHKNWVNVEPSVQRLAEGLLAELGGDPTNIHGGIIRITDVHVPVFRNIEIVHWPR